MPSKDELRSRLLEKRRTLSPVEARKRALGICARLQELEPFRSARRILSYVSSKDNEVDTLPMIAGLLREGRQVLCPRVSGPHLAWHRVNSIEQLRAGAFGILEPDPAVSHAPSEEEALGTDAVVLVPGIAFTPRGDRIGYGRGYFDRFLRSFNGISIGLAYDFQIVDEFEVTPHDVPVDFVVSESRVYYCEEAR